MNIYKEAEKELADLLGWTEVQVALPFQGHIKIRGISPLRYDMLVNVPEWCSDDAEAFKLMVEYDIDVLMWVKPSAQWHQDATPEEADPCFHESDKFLATRYAIVQAVITKLKASK